MHEPNPRRSLSAPLDLAPRGLAPRGLAALLGLAALWASACVSVPLDEREWTVVDSTHFEILSDAGPERTLELAVEFEAFHGFMQELTGLRTFAPRIPTRVFFLTDRATYRRFSPRNSIGYFRATPAANYVVIGETRGASATEVAFHEYSHYVMRSAGLFGYPVWFDEGHADFVSTVRLNGDRIELGRAPALRAQTFAQLGAMPLRRALEAQGFQTWTEEDVARVYALSWAFVHYLYFERENGEALRWQQKDQFMAEVNRGTSTEAAFEAAFGMSFDAMERQLRSYFTGSIPVLTLPADGFLPEQTPRVRDASRRDVLLRLTDLALSAGRTDIASDLLARASPEERGAPEALLLQARTLAASGDRVAAGQEFERALERAPEAAQARIDYGNFLIAGALLRGEDGVIRATGISADERKALLQRGRVELRRAIELAPDVPEAHTELAFSYLAAGEDASQAIAHADRAFELLPSNLTVALQLAEVLIAADRGPEALPILARVRPYLVRAAQLQDYVDALTDQARAATGPGDAASSSSRP